MWGINTKVDRRLSLLEADVKGLFSLRAQLEALNTSLSSLRGRVNAGLGGDVGVVSPPPKKKNVDLTSDLTTEQKEFIAGLPPWETERLNNLEADE